MRLGITVLLALVTHTLCWWPSSSNPAAEAAAAEPVAEVAEPAAVKASCQDGTTYRESCPSWAAAGECEANAAFMLAECRLSCGCKAAPPAPEGPACEDRDTSGSCGMWMASGECEANPSFMKLKCAASCGTCDMLDYKKRCPAPTAEPSVPPGAMAAMFERAVSNFPEMEPEMINLDPPVLVFDKFVTDDEVEALLAHADGRFVRSTASGGRQGDEFVPLTSEIRTSWTTWCDYKECLEDPIIKRLTEKMSDVALVPPNNSEFIQLLRYKECPGPGHPDCQFYRRHHDTIPELETMPCGPRVYTFFLYLSDVEEGGGTKFDLGFTVQPKKGKAVIWPATHNDRPFTQDQRTHHEALPVTKGTKYAANFWIHQYDYVAAHHMGCTA